MDCFCVVLSALPISYLVTNGRYRDRLNRFFLGICLANIVMILGDLAEWTLTAPTLTGEKALLLAALVLYYTASAFELVFSTLYMVEYLKLPSSTRKQCCLYGGGLAAVQIALAAASPFTGILFYLTDEGLQRGTLYLFPHVISLLCYALLLALGILYRTQLQTRERIVFLLYISLPLGCEVVQLFLRDISLINAGVTVSLLIILLNVQFEREMTISQQEKELAERRIDIMLSQIQPHFLYNSLGVIYHLCESDPATARTAIKKFSDFLRGNMDSLKNREPIPFEAELSHVMNYLYLEKQRFGEKLQVIYQIQTENFRIPPLTLQPLVENAVQHGILHRKNGGTVVICTEAAETGAIVKVIDNGVGLEKSKDFSSLGDHSHVGIANVRCRLEEMAGGSLSIESNCQGTTVTICIPWEEGEQL